MNFVVTVVCALGISCPLTQPLKSEFVAKNSSDCHAKIHQVMAAYNFNPKQFSVKCEPK